MRIKTKTVKLTREQAVRECQRLWELIKKYQTTKQDFIYHNSLGKRFRQYRCNCPLCEYKSGIGLSCKVCPLYEQYDEYCIGLGFIKEDSDWFEVVRNLKETL